jgi:opacity protein-like surface antigen
VPLASIGEPVPYDWQITANGRSKQARRGAHTKHSKVLQKGRFLMRPVFFVSVLFATCAILAAPAAAQTEQDRWMLTAQVGPAFGTFGTTPHFDAKGGFRFNGTISLLGEFGGLAHAPFEKAALVAPAVSAPDVFTASKIHVNGYHYNANLMVAPKNWDRVTPYITGGLGAFTGSTVARYNVGPNWQRRYESATNFATNVGGGISYRVNRWFGVNVDYRHFFVNADATEHVNRFTTGISLFVK